MTIKINFNTHLENLKNQDAEVYDAVISEIKRQENTLELIPSENIVTSAVMETQGSVLTNKYSEGYPGKRYYGGNEFIDKTETLAIDRAKKLFRADHANVQPLSGAIMNIAAYFAILETGDTILGMDLGHGGHLTHGHPITHMAKVFNFVGYKTETDKDGIIDYDKLEAQAIECKPKLLLAGFSAYTKTLDWKRFKEIADKVGAITMADVSHIGGLIAANVLENPLDFGFDIMTTTTHKTLRGPRGGLILCKEKYAKAIDKSIFPGLQGGPLEHVIAAKAVAFKEADTPEFVEYQKQVLKNSFAMAKGLMDNGVTLVTNGTENHMCLLDLRPQDIKGKLVEKVLDDLGICTNKNSIPDDTASPLNPNGLRIGVPVITTRGLNETDCNLIGKLIAQVITNIENESIHKQVAEEVAVLCKQYPLYVE
ncbi:MAG: serine hydroxymethyltransferase [Nanoarchaeales archaeon]|nr:serine hydroxymethyltransferase [Nanoarchaeales archaeon]